MPESEAEQTARPLRIGVDVGGTFTDLACIDGEQLRTVKVPSTPPDFHLGVIEAVRRLGQLSATAEIIHGSTVATNALLQRAGAPVAFVTTEGFRDMLRIGRQNRPRLYALHVRRPPPITPAENWFTVNERIDARGNVVQALDDREVEELIRRLGERHLQHAAICLLFSFINPAHERRLGEQLEAAGLTVSLSSRVLPEFREYERASTTAINASLRPVVAAYLAALEQGLAEGSGFRVQDSEPRSRLPVTEPRTVNPEPSLRIMHCGGGTLDPREASEQAAKLVLSGPAGGALGAAWVARQTGLRDVITYDMGGTSTDVATIIDSRPQWTTTSTIDGLPIGLPMFDIQTVGAGGGSVAFVDAGGALRVGPRSAGAVPGPASYGRGGAEPTVTDANLLLGRILPEHFLGGAMKLHVRLAEHAVGRLAAAINKSVIDTALGIVRIAEANMAQAIRAVTARRGHDPRHFALVSFGGAGGLHACALAASLEIPRVLVPPYCGVLSALGMVIAPAVADVSRTVVHRGQGINDDVIGDLFRELRAEGEALLPSSRTEHEELHADVRFRGQSHELKVQIERETVAEIEASFRERYLPLYGSLPKDREIEIVTLRLRRVGPEPRLRLPEIAAAEPSSRRSRLIDADGREIDALAVTREQVRGIGRLTGPAIVIDPDATAYVPPKWSAEASHDGAVILRRT